MGVRKQKGGNSGLDVRAESDIPNLNAMIGGNTTFVLVYADWCGHCHHYMSTWEELEKIPGRKANMAKVHYDMQEKVDAIKDAKIQGYPSVVKVLPSGKMEEYTIDGNDTTNAIQNMRDMKEMRRQLTTQSGGALQMQKQSGGELMTAFLGAIQGAGPAALLLLAYGALQDRQKGGFKSPKRQTRRGRSRKSRYSKTRRFRGK